MSKMGRTFWIVALGVWGLYSCWHFGYQSGYADGHETAWLMYQPSVPVYQMTANRDQNINRNPEVAPDSERTNFDSEISR